MYRYEQAQTLKQLILTIVNICIRTSTYKIYIRPYPYKQLDDLVAGLHFIKERSGEKKFTINFRKFVGNVS